MSFINDVMECLNWFIFSFGFFNLLTLIQLIWILKLNLLLRTLLNGSGEQIIVQAGNLNPLWHQFEKQLLAAILVLNTWVVHSQFYQ